MGGRVNRAADPEGRVFVPFGRKPDAETQKLIDEGKLIFTFSTTGGINPNAKGPKFGTYYKPA